MRPVTAASLQPQPMAEPYPHERSAVPSAPAPELDPASRAWLAALRVTSPGYDDAVARLRALLLRAARFEAGRRRDALRYLRPGELDDIAE